MPKGLFLRWVREANPGIAVIAVLDSDEQYAEQAARALGVAAVLKSVTDVEELHAVAEQLRSKVCDHW